MSSITDDRRSHVSSPSGSPQRSESVRPGSSLVDPASFLHLALDPELKSVTPLHWAYDYLMAIRNGDVEFVSFSLRAPSRGFTVNLLTEPLGPQRQTLLHVAALLNQPGILNEFLLVANRFAEAAATEARLAVRSDMLSKKGGEANIVAYQTKLGSELDKVDRVSRL